MKKLINKGDFQKLIRNLRTKQDEKRIYIRVNTVIKGRKSGK